MWATNRALLVAASLLLPRIAVADPIVFDNGAPSGVNGFAFNEVYTADDFTLASAATIDRIRFWTLISNTAPIGDVSRTFQWAMFGDAGGVPGSILTSGSGTAVPVFDAAYPAQPFSPAYNGYVWALSISPVTLDAGTYWLMLHNGPTFALHPGRTIFWQATTNNPSPDARYGVNFSTHTFMAGPNQDLAFQLSGTMDPIPEPTSMLLVGSGLLGAAGLRRRRQRRS